MALIFSRIASISLSLIASYQIQRPIGVSYNFVFMVLRCLIYCILLAKHIFILLDVSIFYFHTSWMWILVLVLERTFLFLRHFKTLITYFDAVMQSKIYVYNNSSRVWIKVCYFIHEMTVYCRQHLTTNNSQITRLGTNNLLVHMQESSSRTMSANNKKFNREWKLQKHV